MRTKIKFKKKKKKKNQLFFYYFNKNKIDSFLKLTGYKLVISGRTKKRKMMTQTEAYHLGKMPIQTKQAKIEFIQHVAETRLGTLGLKLWFFFEEKRIKKKKRNPLNKRKLRLKPRKRKNKKKKKKDRYLKRINSYLIRKYKYVANADTKLPTRSKRLLSGDVSIRRTMRARSKR